MRARSVLRVWTRPLNGPLPMSRLSGSRLSVSQLSARRVPDGGRPWSRLTQACRVREGQASALTRTPMMRDALPSRRMAVDVRGFSSAPDRRREKQDEAPFTPAELSFEEFQELASQLPKDTLIIDVREAGELDATGKVPHAHHVPVTSCADAFFLDPDEFEDTFGFAKPNPTADRLVFYCKAGVRSRMSAVLAQAAGYEHVQHFPGGWLEWDAKGGRREGP